MRSSVDRSAACTSGKSDPVRLRFEKLALVVGEVDERR